MPAKNTAVSTDIKITLTDDEHAALLDVAYLMSEALKKNGITKSRIPGLLNALGRAKSCALTFSTQTILNDHWNRRLNKAQEAKSKK